MAKDGRLRDVMKNLSILILGFILCFDSDASVVVNVNGTNYTIPSTSGEKGWGTNVTSWIQAISGSTLFPGSATFTLTSDLDFGAAFGLKSIYYKTRSASIASTGQFRLANSDSIVFRNSGNSGDLALTVGASDGILNYNGVRLLSSGSVVNADISSGAAIARAKIASDGLNFVVINDGSGNLSGEAQLAPSRGGSGIANGGTLAWGSNNVTLTTSGVTALTVPTTGTVVTEEATESLSGTKTFGAPLVLTQNATPSAATAGSVRLYGKSDNKIYRMDSGGVEKEIGGGALFISGSRGTPNNITAAVGITPTANQRQVFFAQGSAGAVIVSASPQIVAGTTIGQELILVGRSDANAITLADGTGLSLNGAITLYADTVLTLIWDGTNWVEQERRQ